MAKNWRYLDTETQSQCPKSKCGSKAMMVVTENEKQTGDEIPKANLVHKRVVIAKDVLWED